MRRPIGKELLNVGLMCIMHHRLRSTYAKFESQTHRVQVLVLQ